MQNNNHTSAQARSTGESQHDAALAAAAPWVPVTGRRQTLGPPGHALAEVHQYRELETQSQQKETRALIRGRTQHPSNPSQIQGTDVPFVHGPGSQRRPDQKTSRHRGSLIPATRHSNQKRRQHAPSVTTRERGATRWSSCASATCKSMSGAGNGG